MAATDLIQSLFGATGRAVTRIGLGGEGILRTRDRQEQARKVIERALEQGIGYYDTAPAYAGSEGYLGMVWRAMPQQRLKIFHTSKSAQRTYVGAMRDLERTLATLGTDYLDLWQIHDVREMGDVSAISAPDGALRAFLEARESGVVRYIGVTGHHDPEVLTRCVRDWPLDSVLLPVNPLEGVIGGFLTQTLPAAKSKGLAVVAMKVFGGGHYISPEDGLTPERYLCYALSQPVDVVIAGCANPEEVDLLAHTARVFLPMPAAEQTALLEYFRPHAARLAFYRGKR